MSQPDDEDTKEHPTPFQPPLGPVAPDGTAGPPVAAPATSTDPRATPVIGTPVAPSAADPPPSTASAAPGAATSMPMQPPPQPAQPWQPPQQGWRQPEQGWQQPPGGQWQPPGTYPPGYPPQPYPAQGQYWHPAPAARGTSGLAVFAALLLFALGLVVVLAGIWTLTQGAELGRFIRENDVAVFGRQVDRDTLRTVLSLLPAILILLGVLHLLASVGVFGHRAWGRWLGVLMAVLGLVMGIFGVSAGLAFGGVSLTTIVAIVLVVAYAYVVLALATGGRHFQVTAR